LSRDRVLQAAVALADRDGIDGLTMRRLADELGAEAMSLYYHVNKKEDVLDGLVEVVAAEVNQEAGRLLPADPAGGWQAAVRQRILAGRRVFLRHPWSPPLFETRASASPQVMGYLDALVGLMRDGGLSHDLIHHSLHVLGSRALGFSQELFEPGEAAAPPSPEMAEAIAAHYPHLAGMMAAVVHDTPDTSLGWCDDQFEFEFSLDLILDGLERLRRVEAAGVPGAATGEPGAATGRAPGP
jgi:AcrR family transcriptional regulator